MSTQTTSDPGSPTSQQPAARDFDSPRVRLELHTLLATIAGRFLASPAERLPDEIRATLSAIGRFAGFDRVALALFDESGERWTIDYDWHGQGLWPLAGMQEHIAPFRWGLPQLLAGSPVEILRVKELPRSAANESLLMRGLGVGASLTIPICQRSRVVGFVSGASDTARTEPWPKAFHQLLEMPAHMMVHAIERSAAERRLRASQARWTSLCDSNVIGVFSMRTSDTTITECNEAGLRMLGRTHEDIAGGGIHWRDYSPPEELATDRRMRGILDRTGRVMPWEKQARRADGTLVPVLCSLTSLAPQSDELLSVAIDLSSRRRVADELRRRDAIDRLHADLSRRLLDLSADEIEEAVRMALGDIATAFGFDGAVVFDVDADAEVATRRSWCNRPGLERALPEATVPLTERTWWRERLRAGRTSFVAGIDSLPETARAEREALERLRLEACVSVPLLPGGRLRGLILLYAFHRMDVADDLLATLRTFGDIVANAYERLRIDREIEDALSALERRVDLRRSQLETSNEDLEAFAYSVSHDLRAPLRHIDGMCIVLREDWPDELGPEALALLRRIQGAARRMGHLIDGLLQLSRVVRTPMEWTDVSVSDLVEGLAEDLRRAQPERDIEVRIAAGMTACGHPQLLRIAFEQLLDNAFKFTSSRGGALVEIDAQAEDGRVVYRVRDNGVGFDPEFARKLFGAFQRLHGIDQFEGHGIGLAMVERVARMHGGSAWAEGSPERGATFFLALPTKTRSAE